MIRFVFSKSLCDIRKKIKTSIVHLKMINEEYFRILLDPFISSDWQIEFCELHSFWIVALKKVTLLSPCILCFEIWNEKVYNKHFRYRFNQLKTVLSKLDLFFLIELYDICVQILIFWIVFHRVVGYRLCI